MAGSLKYLSANKTGGKQAGLKIEYYYLQMTP